MLDQSMPNDEGGSADLAMRRTKGDTATISVVNIRDGRSKLPTGPLAGRHGQPLAAPERRVGLILGRWRGVVHHSALDLSGRCWPITVLARLEVFCCWLLPRGAYGDQPRLRAGPAGFHPGSTDPRPEERSAVNIIDFDYARSRSGGSENRAAQHGGSYRPGDIGIPDLQRRGGQHLLELIAWLPDDQTRRHRMRPGTPRTSFRHGALLTRAM